MTRLNIKREISLELNIYRQVWHSYSKQDKPAVIRVVFLGNGVWLKILEAVDFKCMCKVHIP